MNCKYYIPHVWNVPRTLWEDIWLMPENKHDFERSIWLTIDALGDTSATTERPDRIKFQEMALTKLGSSEFWIEGTDMIVRTNDFNREEFLSWARVWLVTTGFEVTELIEGSFTEFKNTNRHATIIGSLSEADFGDS